MKILKRAIGIFFIIFLLFPCFADAANVDIKGFLKPAAEGTGGYAEAGGTTMSKILGSVVNAALSLLGVIFIILIIYAGFLWMTASGNEDQVKKATTILRNAIIGLLLVVGAYAIWYFIERILIMP